MMFTLSSHALQSIATLINAIGKDDVSPILSYAQLTVSATGWTAVATDRYIVAELTGDMGDHVHTLGEDSATILINPADIADYVKRAGKRSTLPVMVTLSNDGSEIELDNNDVKGIYKTGTGNFPPVARLFPEESALSDISVVGFDVNKLARLGKVLPESLVSLSPRNRSNVPMRMRFTVTDTGRPGPVLIDHGKTYPNYRALIQPNILPDYNG